MLWTPEKQFLQKAFERESDLEDAILQIAPTLFGDNRIYIDAKRLIGERGRTRNVPDGYLLDLASTRDAKLYVVENELAKHDPPQTHRRPNPAVFAVFRRHPESGKRDRETVFTRAAAGSQTLHDIR
jgi:hypothetical protein